MSERPALTALRVALATVVLLVAGTIAGIIGLAAAELIPDRLVAERLHDARADGNLTNSRQVPSRLGGVADRFTECITVSVGLGERPGDSLVETIAGGTHLGPCDRLTAALDGFDSNAKLPPGVTYLRYWHGTSTIFRPVIALFGLPALRVLAFGFLVVSTVSLARNVSRIAGPGAAVAFLGPFVLTTDYLELSHVAFAAVALGVALGGANVALLASEHDPTHARAWFAAVMAGAAFVYFDIFTNVPGAWILVAATTMLAVRAVNTTLRRVFTMGMAAGMGWLVGYSAMWLGKWVFAAVVFGREQVQTDIRQSIDERIDGESQWSEDRVGAAIGDNIDFWLDRPFTWVVLVVAILVVALSARRTHRRDGIGALGVSALAAAPALIPFVWYEVASNHSQVHHWFTYRSLPLALGVVLLAFISANTVGRPEPHR